MRRCCCCCCQSLFLNVMRTIRIACLRSVCDQKENCYYCDVTFGSHNYFETANCEGKRRWSKRQSVLIITPKSNYSFRSTAMAKPTKENELDSRQMLAQASKTTNALSLLALGPHAATFIEELTFLPALTFLISIFRLCNGMTLGSQKFLNSMKWTLSSSSVSGRSRVTLIKMET